MMEGSDGRTSPVEPGSVKSQLDGELQALLARVEAATGPDRELDAAICAALAYGGDITTSLAEGWSAYLTPVSADPWREPGRVYVRARHPTEGEARYPHSSWKAAQVTASLDDALALKDRLLPGQAAALGDMAFEDCGKLPWACVWTKGGSPDFTAEAKTPPLALLAALLKALFHQPPRAPQEPGEKAREAK